MSSSIQIDGWRCSLESREGPHGDLMVITVLNNRTGEMMRAFQVFEHDWRVMLTGKFFAADTNRIETIYRTITGDKEFSIENLKTSVKNKRLLNKNK